MAGCGHRESTFQDNKEVRFGGAWLPPPPDNPEMAETEREEEALQQCMPAIQTWVKACRAVCPGIKRGDKVPLRLQLPEQDAGGCDVVGLYQKKVRSGWNFR